jgi:hypothetical protein
LIIVYRYRAVKRNDGHFSFDLHAGASVLRYAEYWNADKGWEIICDVLSDTEMAVERRHFFLCGTGTRLDALGDEASVYFVDAFEAHGKGYISYLFETTHLPETLRLELDAKWKPRPAPTVQEMGRSQRKFARPRVVGE